MAGAISEFTIPTVAESLSGTKRLERGRISDVKREVVQFAVGRLSICR